MFNILSLGIKIFFSRKSPYAFYRNPKSLCIVLLPRILNILVTLNTIIYNKKKVKCNICGWEGNTFGFGGSLSSQKINKNHFCLQCKSTPRGILLIKYVADEVINRGRKFSILEIGPAKYTSEYFRALDNISYISLDLFKDFTDFKMDVTDLKFEKKKFDVVICSHVLEHIEKYEKAIKEMYGILKKDGLGIIMIPINENMMRTEKIKGETFLGYGHRWNFGQDFHQILNSIGFIVTQINYCKYLSQDEIKKYGLKDEPIFQVERSGA